LERSGKREMEGYKVDAIDIKDQEKGDPVFFKTKYGNYFFCGKKHSGKTNLIYHVMRNIVGPNTDIYIFCSTARRDKTWIQMIEELENKGNKVVVYDSIYDTIKEGKRKRHINNLEILMDTFKNEEGEPKKNKKDKKKEKKQEKQVGGFRIPNPFERNISWDMLEENHIARNLFPVFNTQKEEQEEVKVEKPKKRRGKKLYPEKILILDDLSDQIKDPIVPAILKVNRHYKMTTLLSSQYPSDITPSGRSQFNGLFMWKGHSPNKVETLRRMCDTNLDEKEFYNLYKETTAEPYAFMYCDIDNGKIYRNFEEVVYE